MATEETAAATATASDATTPAGIAPDQSQPPTAAEVLQAGKEAAPEVIANQDAENAAAAVAATTPALVTEIAPAPAPKTPGQVAYEGYCASSKGKSLISGADLPTFDKLKAEIRAAWEHAAHAVKQVVDDSVEHLSEVTHEMELAAAHDAALVEHKIMDTISRCSCEVKGGVKELRQRLTATLKHLACKLCGLPVESAGESQRS